MKYFVLSLFVVAAFAAPTPDNGDVELIVHGVPEGQPLEIGDVLDIKVKDAEDSHTDLLYPLTAVGIAEAAAAEAAAQPLPEAPVDVVDVVDVQPIVMPAPVEPDVSVDVQPIVLPAPVEPDVSVDVQPIVLPAPVEPDVSVDVQPIVMPAPVEPDVSVDVQPIVLPAPVEPVVVSPIVPEPIVVSPGGEAPVFVDGPVEVVEPAPVGINEPEILPEPAAQSPGEVFNDGVVQVQVNTPEEAGVLSTLQSWFSLAVNYISNGIQSTQQIV